MVDVADGCDARSRANCTGDAEGEKVGERYEGNVMEGIDGYARMVDEVGDEGGEG